MVLFTFFGSLFIAAAVAVLFERWGITRNGYAVSILVALGAVIVLFFLRALDCTDADQIANYIEAHNARIEGLINDPDFTKSRNEFRKAVFRAERKAKILDTIRTLRMPVFAIYEYGHLLIDEMSPKTTEKLIEDLRFGGILARRTDDRIGVDQKRILIASTGFLEDVYRLSLLMQRRMIAMGLSDEELRRARQLSD